MLSIRTRFSWSTDYAVAPGQSERLVGICRQAGATAYVSGPSARAYLQPEIFDQAGIALEYFDYAGYREYPQLFPPFEHRVSVVDLIFNTGPRALDYLERP